MFVTLVCRMSGDIDLKDFLITMLAFRPTEAEETRAPTDTQTIKLYFDIFVSVQSPPALVDGYGSNACLHGIIPFIITLAAVCTYYTGVGNCSCVCRILMEQGTSTWRS